MSISNRALAIIGGAAALVIVPAGVTFGMVAAHDVVRHDVIERAIANPGQQNGPGAMGHGMFGNTPRVGDRDRTQARDGSFCDGAGPLGRDGDNDRRGGMMGGFGQGMMDGSGPRNR